MVRIQEVEEEEITKVQTENSKSKANTEKAAPSPKVQDPPVVKNEDPILEAARKLKTEGNDLFAKQQYDDAIQKYTEAMNVLGGEEEIAEEEPQKEPQETKSAPEQQNGPERGERPNRQPDNRPVEEREEERRKLLEEKKRADEEKRERRREKLRAFPYAQEKAIYRCNRAACFLNLQEFEKVIRDCSYTIDIDPYYVKAYVRRAKSYEQLGKLEEALEDYKQIVKLDPKVSEAIEAVQRLPAQIKEKREKEMEEMLGKLKDVGNSVLGWFGLSLDNFAMEKGPDGSYSLKTKQPNQA